MGRGNACVTGKYEGLFYIDWDNFSTEYEDEEGNVIRNDYEWQCRQYDEDRREFTVEFCYKFRSFSPCDKWISKEEHAIAESRLFYLVEEGNEWSMAIKLIQKNDDDENIERWQEKHFETYLEGLKNILFMFYPELGVYGGPWTHGIIKRPE